MENKMSLIGVAGKIFIVLLISLMSTMTVSLLCQPLFRITEYYEKLVFIGLIMAVTGFTFNLIAGLEILRAYRKEQLATSGLYSIFLNPMYAFQILITIPGLLLLCNSWLVMATLIPVFVAYKVFVKEEEMYLESKFGDKYREYRNKVLCKAL